MRAVQINLMLLDRIDAELPLDVDDEHYDEATKQWNQPADKVVDLIALNIL